MEGLHLKRRANHAPPPPAPPQASSTRCTATVWGTPCPRWPWFAGHGWGIRVPPPRGGRMRVPAQTSTWAGLCGWWVGMVDHPHPGGRGPPPPPVFPVFLILPTFPRRPIPMSKFSFSAEGTLLRAVLWGGGVDPRLPVGGGGLPLSRARRPNT